LAIGTGSVSARSAIIWRISVSRCSRSFWSMFVGAVEGWAEADIFVSVCVTHGSSVGSTIARRPFTVITLKPCGTVNSLRGVGAEAGGAAGAGVGVAPRAENPKKIALTKVNAPTRDLRAVIVV